MPAQDACLRPKPREYFASMTRARSSNRLATFGLADVAAAADVSTATVSRVLNHPAAVREQTREAVVQAIHRLGYPPNLNARTLAGGTSRTIGVIVSNLENPFFVDVFRSLETEARQLGYEVVVAETVSDQDRLRT